ncbi:MAG: 5'-3' exonuclease H3TH domain-containing protein [Candidatus Methylomirabilales bacterium]
MSGAPRLVLVDGSASLYRAFFALPPLSTAAGLPTHAVLGFTTMLLKLLREEAPQAVAVVFDGPGRTARHRAFPEYKAQRPATPDSLFRQIPHVHRVLEALRVAAIAVPGEEADDVLGALALRAAGEGYAVVLVTGDKDLLQLVSQRIVLREPLKAGVTGRAEVEARFGLPPERLPDFFALTGDHIDNIPGVPGVGAKTATELVQRFGSVEALLGRLAEVPRAKLRETLAAHAERIRLNRRLVALDTSLSLPCAVGDLARREPDRAAMLALCEELEFHRLAQQFRQPDLTDRT